MSEKETGGPAFSVQGINLPNGEFLWPETGMTLRDYFIAHAPADPQLWFKPVMPEKPIIPNQYELLSNEQQKEWLGLGEWLEDSDVVAEVLEFRDKFKVAITALEAWETEREKQQFVQWPAAWADAMLQARKS